MSLELQGAAVYTLGLIGLIAIGIIPVRLMSIIRLRRSPKRAKLSLQLVAWNAGFLACVAALVIDVMVVARITKCLTSTVCGAGIATGWFHASVLGAVYLLLETALWALRGRATKPVA